jgi:hypothetical protein
MCGSFIMAACCWTIQHIQAKDASQGNDISRIDTPKE